MARDNERSAKVVDLIVLLVLIPAVVIGADRLIEWLW